jgi:hypothetical protein
LTRSDQTYRIDLILDLIKTYRIDLIEANADASRDDRVNEIESLVKRVGKSSNSEMNSNSEMSSNSEIFLNEISE